MPSASVRLEISEETWSQVDRELVALELIGTQRSGAVKRGLKTAGEVVEARVRETLPLPGYPGDKPGLKPLRDTVNTKVKDYGNGLFAAIVGYEYPAGAHGHNVEAGHRIASGGTLVNPKRKTPPKSKVTGERGLGQVDGFVEGRWDIRNAAEATQFQQEQAVISGVLEAIAEARA